MPTLFVNEWNHIVFLFRPLSLIDSFMDYWPLVYTTQENSAFRVIWLVPQSRDIKYYSPPGGFRVLPYICYMGMCRWIGYCNIVYH